MFKERSKLFFTKSSHILRILILVTLFFIKIEILIPLIYEVF